MREKDWRKSCMKDKEKIIKLIICISLISAVAVLRIFSKYSESKKEKNSVEDILQENESDENNMENEVNTATENKQYDSENDENGTEEKISNIEDTMIESQEYYDENASDGSEGGIYFTNGDILYENDEIPLGVYTNQMSELESFINLNYVNVTEITIVEESVLVKDGYLRYTCDLHNEHLLYVVCNLSTYEFSFADSPKYE